MKTINHLPQQPPHKSFDQTLHTTTLAQIQTSHFNTKLSSKGSHECHLPKNSFLKSSPTQPSYNEQSISSDEFCIVEINGQQYQIGYENIEKFEKNLQKLTNQLKIRDTLAFKVVLLSKLVRVDTRFTNCLEKCIQQYGNKKFHRISIK